MNNEFLFEEGVVLASGNGFAEISLNESEACEECSAKLFCRPSNGIKKTISVTDPLGVHPGDEVRISVRGSSIFKASFLLYGIPLIILVAAIFAGLKIFNQTYYKELFSFLLGIGSTGLYFLMFKFLSSRKSSFQYPEIVFVKKK